MNNGERIKVALVGGYTRRWHAEDIIGEERVDSHTWGMLAILYILIPPLTGQRPSADLLEAVTFHDSPGEPFSGDIPYGAKQAFPELRAADHAIGARTCAAIGVRGTEALSEGDAWWLAFADMGQAYLFLKRQVAQGNQLVRDKVQHCATALEKMRQGDDPPTWAWEAVQALYDCKMGLPMSRNLEELENNAC